MSSEPKPKVGNKNKNPPHRTKRDSGQRGQKRRKEASLEDVLNVLVPVDNKGRHRLTKFEVIMRGLFAKAMSGDGRAIKKWLGLLAWARSNDQQPEPNITIIGGLPDV